MTDTKPEALRLADEIDFELIMGAPTQTDQLLATTAKELRRLHEVNQRLVEALSFCLYHGDGIMSESRQSYLPPSVRYIAKAALKKAEGESNETT